MGPVIYELFFRVVRLAGFVIDNPIAISGFDKQVDNSGDDAAIIILVSDGELFMQGEIAKGLLAPVFK